MIRRASIARVSVGVAFVAAVGVAAGIVTVACTVFDGLSVPAPDASTLDGGGDARDGSVIPADPCAHVLPPGPPDAGDRQGQLAFVVRSLELGGAAAGGESSPRGYDLDGVCSCGPGAPAPSCIPRDAATMAVCDGDGGLDNAAASVFDFAATNGVALSDVAANALARGETSLLVALSDYASDDDDRTVQVDLYVSVGPKNKPDGGGAPTFLPDESWRLDKTRSLDNTTQPRPLARGLGFVSGRVLVVSLDRVMIPLDAERQIDLRSAVLTARIAADGASLTGGVVAGRWEQADALRTFANLRRPTDGGFSRFCDDKPALEAVRARVCDSRDLAPTKEGDRTGAACGALSVAVGFEAVKAVIEQDGVVTTRSDACGVIACEP